MTSERLNELQAELANCDKQIAHHREQVEAWAARKIAFKGAYEEVERTELKLAWAGAFTGWLNPPITVIEVPDA